MPAPLPRSTLLAALATAAVLLPACTWVGTNPPPRVQQFGVMREVMAEGKTEARVRLSAYERKGTFGVGALAGLAGEVLLDDGIVYTTRESARQLENQAGTLEATLLTVTQVAAWRELPLPAGTDLEGLEALLAAAVPAAAREAAEPVPFVIEGPATLLAMHVVRGSCPHAPREGGAAPDLWRSVSQTAAARVRVVGFHAPGKEGVVTHHGTAIHAHALVLDGARGKAMGHVDELVIAAGAKLRVPAAAE